ncbi:MAG: phosphoglucosamine mutase [Henriciella sp.]|jgi:phosphoglucosamine mutase|uniref:phosphoglucosamine mutase n=1 Tax=Henriciella sp. TaxID=1968823 RepID=UPI000C0E3A42|nr:phosphoglucosamine mutase [Henriciella sp.]MBF33098.1 phosphoglucosamine mutase [Hyphomonadaceae bacterium]MBK74912.1 phosphoglucosamine mutase [Henriciella sp.]PHR71948.1 MAG: phosphoglucosamine mutase [Henriciella sp.]|tara:strand:+ start:177 stop:1523 length:1347 start_codon:yes stop_codon:yes gene_type:complete
MSRKYFGTDGIRGTANTPPMTPEIAMRLGMAAGKYFRRGGTRRHSVVIGKDTRLSGYMIEPALVAGFTSVGMDVTLFGPLPTPGVAMMTRSLRADLGVMISASHNAYEDNGLKLFGPDGYKLSDEIELEIESRMDRALDDKLAAPSALGRTRRVDDAQARYIEIVKATFPRGMRLSNLRVCIDCANGAAYKVAPTALYELGAEVFPIGVSPDGFNINQEVGSTNTHALREAVRKYRADIGIALDGDADRCILVDERGEEIDGDQLIGLIAGDWKRRGLLARDGVVATVMSNLGLEKYLKSIDLQLERTKVGDRYVVEKMREGGFNLGGEQSGHIVVSDHVTTGDGMIAALQALAVMVETGKPLSELANVFETVPQKLINVRYNSSAPLENDDVKAAINAVETRLGSTGRLVIRKSGTEPLIRVMAEAEDADMMEEAVNEVADAVRAAG